ncbi:MAG: hypothetical protein R3284_10405, partial [Rubricoccaceae bacterium]|nr:hypothetical protein [Rubricoccaceae bacterium]
DFNHDATGFSLVGAHTSLDCSSCHTGPEFEPIWIPQNQNDCYTCHEGDHENVHPAFPTSCIDCHNTSTWAGATFDHDATGFSLVGAHVGLDCSACHTGPDFEPIWIPQNQNDCFTCHEEDSQQAHQGFPTTCLDCHTVETWAGATFDHDPLFPIYSGRHEGEWDTCQTCHIVPGDFSVFSCLTCHEHNQVEMDDRHEDVPGYVYESTACYSCHPDGKR